MRIFNHKDLLTIFPGIKSRTLMSWSERGLLTSLIEAQGYGSRRLYNFHNLIEIATIQEMVSYRIHREIIKDVLSALRDRVSKQKNYDFVIILRRQYAGSDRKIPGYVLDPTIKNIDELSRDANNFLFDEKTFIIEGSRGRSRQKSIFSAVIISVYDIHNLVKELV